MAVRKQSSSQLSTFATRMLRRIERKEYEFILLVKADPTYGVSYDEMKVDQLQALCASVLSQDETKGQKRAPRKRKTP